MNESYNSEIFVKIVIFVLIIRLIYIVFERLRHRLIHQVIFECFSHLSVGVCFLLILYGPKLLEQFMYPGQIINRGDEERKVIFAIIYFTCAITGMVLVIWERLLKSKAKHAEEGSQIKSNNSSSSPNIE